MSLSHNLDEDWLRAAYRRTRKDVATGVDGVSAKAYAEELDRNQDCSYGFRRLLDKWLKAGVWERGQTFRFLGFTHY